MLTRTAAYSRVRTSKVPKRSGVGKGSEQAQASIRSIVVSKRDLPKILGINIGNALRRKGLTSPPIVIPAKAGIQGNQRDDGPGFPNEDGLVPFRGNDGREDVALVAARQTMADCAA